MARKTPTDLITFTMIIVGAIIIIFALMSGLSTLSMGFIGLIFLTLGYTLYKYKLEKHTILDLFFSNQSSKKIGLNNN